jgi:hypothetical protein
MLVMMMDIPSLKVGRLDRARGAAEKGERAGYFFQPTMSKGP